MRSHLGPFALTSFGVLLVLCAASSPVLAGWTPTAVPEIDGASLTAGIGLLGAGLAMLRARLRNR